MLRTESKPFLIYGILVVTIMLGLGIILGQLTKNYFFVSIQDRVQNEGILLSSLVQDLSLEEPSDMAKLREMSEKLEVGMIFISETGKPLLDTTSEVLRLTEGEKEAKISFINNTTKLTKFETTGFIKDRLFYFPIDLLDGNLKGTLVLMLAIDSLTHITQNIWIIIGITMLIAVVAIFIIGYHLFDKYIKPIRSAANVTNQLAEGNYNARTYEGNYGEVGQLSHSINVLARNLQEMFLEKEIHQDRLQAVVNNMGSGLMLIDEKGYINLINRAFLEKFGGNSNEYLGYLYYEAIDVSVVHKVVKDVFMTEDKTRETVILERGIDRLFIEINGAPIFSEGKDWEGVALVFHDITDLKRLELMRKDFVANVSHELKTPITSIRGFSETLLDGAMDDPALCEQFITIILKESRRLQSLIVDLLELSKLEKESFNLNVDKISITSLLSDVYQLIEYQAQEKEIDLKFALRGKIDLEGDYSRLKQVFINLLTNAITYTPKSGNVSITTLNSRDTVTITIKDTGIGIPEEELPRIFERFYRVDKARSRNSGGTGLGLAIVKHIVEAHNGSIKVENNIPKGTVFHITIPKTFTRN